MESLDCVQAKRGKIIRLPLFGKSGEVCLFNSSLPEAEFLDVIWEKKSEEFSSLLFTVTSINELYSPPLLEQKWP